MQDAGKWRPYLQREGSTAIEFPPETEHPGVVVPKGRSIRVATFARLASESLVAMAYDAACTYDEVTPFEVHAEE